MDRSFEEIRTEVLELDRESQRRLADEIEENLGEPDEEAYTEAARRMEAYRRGEGTTVSADESVARVRRIIEEHKKSRL